MRHLGRSCFLIILVCALLLGLVVGIITPALTYSQEKTTNAELLLKVDQNKLSLHVAKNSNGEITCEASCKDSKDISVAELEGPYRIIVDLIGCTEKIAKNLQVPNNEIIKSVRIGSHPDKLRIVLDVFPEQTPLFEWNKDKNKLQFKLTSTKTGAIAPVTQASPAQTIATSTPVSLPSLAPTFTITSEPTLAPTATFVKLQPSLTLGPSPTPVATATLTIKATAIPTATHSEPHTENLLLEEQSLNNIQFSYTDMGHEPVVKLLLQQKALFNLTKKEERLYLLVVPNSDIRYDYLDLIQFPPHDFIGLTYLKAKKTNDNLEVEIGVERGIKISAIPNNNEIWIRSLNK